MILMESQVKETSIFRIQDDMYFSINYLSNLRQKKYFNGKGCFRNKR